MFNIAKLSLLLFFISIIDEEQDRKTSRINSVQRNARIIDHHKNWNILLFEEAIKIKEKKIILNTTLKASRGITTVLD